MIKLPLKRPENRVNVKCLLPEKFEVKDVARQGDPLASRLFNIILEKLIQEAKIKRSGLFYQNELRNPTTRLEYKASAKGVHKN